MRITWLATTAVVLLAAPTLASAQPAPTFTYGKSDDVKDVEATKWEATAEAGLVVTTGNSQTITVSGGAKATRKQQQNKFSVEASGTFARASNTGLKPGAVTPLTADEIERTSTTSAESYNVKLRYDRFLTTWDSLYLAALGGADIIAGKDFVGGGQVGYARTVYKTEQHEVTGEVGYDFSYEDLAAGDSHQIHSGRGFLGYKGKLSAETSLVASLEALDNVNAQGDVAAFEDLRTTASAALSTKITKGIAVSLSFTARYDNAPAPFKAPADFTLDPTNPPENAKLDTTSKASLIITLL